MAHNDSLKSLHTALIDARKGYETAAKNADTSEMQALFRKMIAQHDGAHHEVHAILAARGETPDEDGSFMAGVHKAVISVRATVVGLGPSALSSFADGEERIADAYEAAIEDNLDDPAAVKTLRHQKAALLQRIAQMQTKAVESS